MKEIFCRKTHLKNRNIAAMQSTLYDFLFNHGEDVVLTKLQDLKLEPEYILQLGSRRGNLSNNLITSYQPELLVNADLSYKFLAQNNLHDKTLHKLVVDEENLCFKPESFNLIISLLNIHWINDIKKFFINIKSMLKPHGTFIGSMIGGQTLKKLRFAFYKAEKICGSQFHMRINPMIKLETITHLLHQLKFKNIVTDSELIQVNYKNIKNLMYDLKFMGENSAFRETSNYSMTKKLLVTLEHIYSNPFSEKFELLFVKFNI